MDRSPLRIVYARAALRELDAVWEWNAERHGTAHASTYVAFLRTGIARLASDPESARPIVGFPELSRITLRRSRGDGHVAVVQIGAETVDILHVYHTKQDLIGRLRSEREK